MNRNISLFAVCLIAGLGLAPHAATADAPPALEDTSVNEPGNSVGVGVALGHPTRAVGKYVLPGGTLSLGAGIGSGMTGGKGLQITAGLAWERDLEMVHLSVGAGARYYRHVYEPASMDETGHDRHLGLRAVAAVSKRLAGLPVDLFAEAAPGIDLTRTASCTFLSGVDTVCPHDRSTPLFLDLAVGARYWFDL